MKVIDMTKKQKAIKEEFVKRFGSGETTFIIGFSSPFGNVTPIYHSVEKIREKKKWWQLRYYFENHQGYYDPDSDKLVIEK